MEQVWQSWFLECKWKRRVVQEKDETWMGVWIPSLFFLLYLQLVVTPDAFEPRRGNAWSRMMLHCSRVKDILFPRLYHLLYQASHDIDQAHFVIPSFKNDLFFSDKHQGFIK